MLPLERGQRIDRERILRKLVEIQYERNDHDFARGTFRVRGDVVEVFPSYEELAVRIELFGDEVDELITFDPLTGKTLKRHDKLAVYPKSHFVTPRETLKRAVGIDQGGTGAAPRGAGERKASSSKRSACTSARCSTSR